MVCYVSADIIVFEFLAYKFYCVVGMPVSLHSSGLISTVMQGTRLS